MFELDSLQKILGNIVARPTKLDVNLAQELKSLANLSDDYQTVVGKTYCADDFYEGELCS